jgi:protocatechuate 3,4-dioxygenase, alpha subunit
MSDELIATPSQTAGPFFHLGLHSLPGVPNAGDRIRLRIAVTDGDGKGVDDALLELWHAGGFARAQTGPEGSCELELNRPDDSRPYVNVCVFARGLLRQLQTRIYLPGASALDSDQVLAGVPERRRGTLMAQADPHEPARWTFPLRLQGAEETVFFDG